MKSFISFTKLAGFILAILFANTTANATVITLQDSVMTVNYNEKGWDRLDNVNKMDRQATIKLVIIGNHDGNTTTFQNNNDWAIQTLDLSQAILPSQYTFKRLYNLKEIVWPTTSFVIPRSAFELAEGDINNGMVPSLAEITIPSNCTEVQAHAFGCHTALQTINIEGPSTILRTESFNNVKNVKDVYIKSGEALNPATGQCFCEFGAFDFWVTWVQTQMSRLDEAACLHFPKDVEENIKWYCNPNVDVLTQKVLNDNYHEACNTSRNGWHEFIVNDNMIVEQTDIFRTFSDTSDHLFPQCKNVEDGVKVYYVVGTTEINGVKKILIEPLNEDGDYILPAYTGALLYTKKGFVMYQTKEDNFTCIAQYYNNTPKGNINYLECLQDAPESGVDLGWSMIRRNVQCVNMFLNNKRKVDLAPVEWGFYTIIPKHYEKSEIEYRAYLNMPASIVDGDSMYGFYDGNGDVPPAVRAKDGKVFDLNLDENDELEGDVAGIFQVVRENVTATNNNYYNAAGQQMSAPAKGLYIHNGKKFMK